MPKGFDRPTRPLLRVAAADDEILARDYLRSLLEDRNDIELVGVHENGNELIDLLDRDPDIDLIMVDIRMPDVDGLEVARHAAESGTLVIFTTAYDVHAIEAFDMEAVDYLLKPFDADRLDRALERAVERSAVLSEPSIDKLIEKIGPSEPHYLKKFIVRHKEKTLILDPDEVNWIEAYGNYVRLHTNNARYHLRATMKSLEKALDPDQFLRIHRSAMVRIDSVRELHRASHGDMNVRLKSGDELTLSRHYRDRVEALMGL